MKKIFLLLFLLTFCAANAQSQGKNDKPYDFVQGTTEYLTKMLTLDGFQEAAVKNFLDDYKKDMESIRQMPEQARQEKFVIAGEKMEASIFSVLNKEQIQKYKEEKEKKENKNKKSKKKKKETE